VAAGPSGDVYVLDWNKPHIVRLSPRGTVVTSWAASAYSTLGGIAVDGQEHVYFLRNLRHGKRYVGALTRYSSSGRPLATWFNSAWLNPIAIAAAQGGTLYVLAPGNTGKHQSAVVVTVSPTGKVLNSWHLPTYGHDFLSATAIATDAHGNVYVSANVGNCSRGCNGSEGSLLIRRAPSGSKSVKTWTTVTQGVGLAVDAAGSVYTAIDYFVSKFSSTGAPVARWGRVGCGPLAFRRLTGLTIDGRSNLYALDSDNNTIQKISTSGQPEAIWGACPPATPPTPIRPTPRPAGVM
jgi:hypothetical protein